MTPPHPSPARNNSKLQNTKRQSKGSRAWLFSVLVMLPSCKMTGKIILVFTFAPTYVTLKRIFIPMTSHVDGVKDIVGKVHVTVLAVVEKLRVLDGQGGSWSARLAVSHAWSTCVGTRFTARPCHRTVVPLTVWRPRLGAGGRGALRKTCWHGRNYCLGRGLLHHEGLLLGAGNYIRGRRVLVFRWQTGQLSG